MLFASLFLRSSCILKGIYCNYFQNGISSKPLDHWISISVFSEHDNLILAKNWIKSSLTCVMHRSTHVQSYRQYDRWIFGKKLLRRQKFLVIGKVPRTLTWAVPSHFVSCSKIFHNMNVMQPFMYKFIDSMTDETLAKSCYTVLRTLTMAMFTHCLKEHLKCFHWHQTENHHVSSICIYMSCKHFQMYRLIIGMTNGILINKNCYAIKNSPRIPIIGLKKMSNNC